MRVNGELFFLINGWMNYLSLLLASCLGRVRMRRAVLPSVLGAGYALAAWGAAPFLRGVPCLALTALGMGAIAFGRHAVRLWPLVMTGGLLLSGLCDFLWKRGVPAGAAMLLCGGAVLAMIRLFNGRSLPGKGNCTVEILYRGTAVRLPAMRDSGNLLRDAITGLPVIVAPWEALSPLLPPGACPEDPARLPTGFRLMAVCTVSGKRLLWCFHPQETAVISQGKKRSADAVIALSGEKINRALVPDVFFEEGFVHADL